MGLVQYKSYLFELNYVYLIRSKYNTEYYDYVYPSWIWFDTFNLDLRETLPSLYWSLQKVPGIYDQWAYFRTVWSICGSWRLAGIKSYRILLSNYFNRNLKKFMSTRKVKFNYQVVMDIFMVAGIYLFSLDGQRYKIKEYDYLLYIAEFVWVFRSIRLIFRIAWYMWTNYWF